MKRKCLLYRQRFPPRVLAAIFRRAQCWFTDDSVVPRVYVRWLIDYVVILQTFYWSVAHFTPCVHRIEWWRYCHSAKIWLPLTLFWLCVDLIGRWRCRKRRARSSRSRSRMTSASSRSHLSSSASCALICHSVTSPRPSLTGTSPTSHCHVSMCSNRLNIAGSSFFAVVEQLWKLLCLVAADYAYYVQRGCTCI